MDTASQGLDTDINHYPQSPATEHRNSQSKSLASTHTVFDQHIKSLMPACFSIKENIARLNSVVSQHELERIGHACR